MSVINFSTGLAVAKFTWGQQRRDIVFASSFGSQAVEDSPALWAASLSVPADYEINAGAWQSLLMQLRGRVNQLALWNLGRPVPRGTMRGAMTLTATVAAGVTSFGITASTEAGKTLKQGDYLGIGSATTQQVVMLTADATADGTGAITVNFLPPLRNGFNAAEPITWNMPCALFRQNISKFGWDYTPGSILSGIALDLIEDWR